MDARPEMGTRAALVAQRDEDVVLHHRARAPHVKLRIHGPHRSQQLHGLIDEVAAEVEQQPAAVGGVGLLAPRALFDLRSPAVEAGLQPQHLPQPPLADHPAQRQEVVIPAPVVKGRQDDARRRGLRRQALRLGARDRQRLVHDNVLARLQRRAREVGVEAVRRGHDHKVDGAHDICQASAATTPDAARSAARGAPGRA